MLVNDKEALKRIGSPLNLLNRIKERSNASSKAMGLFVPNRQPVEQGKFDIKTPAVPIFNPFHKDSPSESSKSIPPVEPSKSDTTAEEVNIDKLLDGADNKINLAHAHNDALDLMNSAIRQLKTKLDDVKPEKIPSIITAASKVVEGIRKERNDAAKANGNRSVHLHFYTPQQRKIENYDVIDVG